MTDNAATPNLTSVPSIPSREAVERIQKFLAISPELKDQSAAVMLEELLAEVERLTSYVEILLGSEQLARQREANLSTTVAAQAAALSACADHLESAITREYECLRVLSCGGTLTASDCALRELRYMDVRKARAALASQQSSPREPT